MKERLKKFWEEHQTEIAIYSLGFIAGTITTCVIAKKAVDGRDIVAGRIWDEEEETRIVIFHRNGNESYLRKTTPTQAA